MRYFHERLGGEYVTFPCTIHSENFPAHVLEQDSPDTVWFFTDLYFHLHPKLVGRQIFVGHGVSFKRNVFAQRAECFNQHIDSILCSNPVYESICRDAKVQPEKIIPVGYTTLYYLPKVPLRPKAVFIAAPFWESWNPHAELARILKRIRAPYQGYFTFHPEMPSSLSSVLINAVRGNPAITLLETQDQILEAAAFCEVAIAGNSSMLAPFWYLQKPFVLVAGGLNPWKRIRAEANHPLFNEVLEECSRLSMSRLFHPAFLKFAKKSPAASRIFYPWQGDFPAIEAKLIEALEVTGASIEAAKVHAR